MSEILFMYKKMVAAAKVKNLGEDSLKFSVNLSKEYADMLQEMTGRVGMQRAELARLLICTALDEIDQAFNLRNDEDFDYEQQLHAEEYLADLDESRTMYEIDKKSDRASHLRWLLNNFVPEQPDNEETKKLISSVTKELKELESEGF